LLVPHASLIPFGARRKIDTLLPALKQSAHAFHLAGSWYFRAATADSDVDLYVEYSPEAHEYLRSQGFAIMGANPDYPDNPSQGADLRGHVTSNTVAIYQHATLPVQVQAFADLALALRMRDILARVFPDEHARTRGPHRHQMWAAAETAARTILALQTPPTVNPTASA
jgi:hypothetical protein